MRRLAPLAGILGMLAIAIWPINLAYATVTVTQISSDPYSTPTVGQHRSEVEPDTLSNGSKVIAAVQEGRIFDGGSTDIGWSTYNGSTWSHGSLPGLTKNAKPAGIYDRASDPSVAYDAKHGVWLISSLGIVGGTGQAVLVSRSTNGTVWNNPVTVSSTSTDFYDKEWVVCDNTATSPFYGHCYAEWDDNSLGDLLLMSTSADGGLTWGAPQAPTGGPSGLGGQPLVQPNGTVIVPYASGTESAIGAFSSSNGGTTWGSVTTISTVSSHGEGGGLRSGPLPTAEIDGAGKVYVAWQDCRFEGSCSANDIVMSSSTNGTTWSSLTRIPIDAQGSGVDHFIPGLAVNTATSGSTAHMALTYYYYPQSNCSFSTCKLDVGFVSSSNAGSTWTTSTQLAGPMQLAWLANTNQGSMVGDYISTSFLGNNAINAFAVGHPLSGSTLHENLYSTHLPAVAGSIPAGPSAPRTGTDLPVLTASQAAVSGAIKTAY